MKNGKLRQFVDKIKPTFEKGGKLSFLESFFEAVETFLFVPNTVTIKGTHIKDNVDLKRSFILVMLALVPALIMGMFNTGFQHFLSQGESVAFWSWQALGYGFIRILPLLIVSYGVGLGIEIAVAQVKGHEVSEGFFVTGILIPLIVPIDTPLWMLALAVAFAVNLSDFLPVILSKSFCL
jgi:Na+-transporting NADH:ubiquinone oxidoreductase subunit B